MRASNAEWLAIRASQSPRLYEAILARAGHIKASVIVLI
jgi:hypothetical protein